MTWGPKHASTLSEMVSALGQTTERSGQDKRSLSPHPSPATATWLAAPHAHSVDHVGAWRLRARASQKKMKR